MNHGISVMSVKQRQKKLWNRALRLKNIWNSKKTQNNLENQMKFINSHKNIEELNEIVKRQQKNLSSF